MKSTSVLHSRYYCGSLTYMTATQHILTATRHKQVTHALTHTTTFVPSRVACVAMCHTYIYIINISTGICPRLIALMPSLGCTDASKIWRIPGGSRKKKFMKFRSCFTKFPAQPNLPAKRILTSQLSMHFLYIFYTFSTFLS